MTSRIKKYPKINFSNCPSASLGFPSIFGATERRERLQILWEVLQCGSNPVKKTNLMYKVGLSHYQTEMYLGFLMSRGFLAKQDSRICTTEKGKRFLSLLVELAEMLRGSPEHTNQVVPGTATLSESEAKKKNTTPRKSR